MNAHGHASSSFDGMQADWRTTPSAHNVQRQRFSHRLRAGLTNVISADPRERHDIAVFLVGCGWGVMCAIGMLAAWGIHP